jgi:hypothetical protein
MHCRAAVVQVRLATYLDTEYPSVFDHPLLAPGGASVAYYILPLAKRPLYAETIAG